MKNIFMHLEVLINAIEVLIKWMQQKAHFLKFETVSYFQFGFKTPEPPSSQKDLMEFG